jgi:hypothetical protein
VAAPSATIDWCVVEALPEFAQFGLQSLQREVAGLESQGLSQHAGQHVKLVDDGGRPVARGRRVELQRAMQAWRVADRGDRDDGS